MILGRIFHYITEPTEKTKKDEMNIQKVRNDSHLEWIRQASGEASKRFLKLEPTDAGETHWRLYNSSGELVYPQHAYGANRSSINGYFASNPQA